MLIKVYKDFNNVAQYINVKDIKRYFTVNNKEFPDKLDVLVETYDKNKYEIAYEINYGCYVFLILKLEKIINQNNTLIINPDDITIFYEDNTFESFWYKDNAFEDLYKKYQQLIDKISDLLLDVDTDISTTYKFSKYLRKHLSTEEMELYYSKLVNHYEEKLKEIDTDLAQYML